MAFLLCTFDLLLQMRGCLFVRIGEVVRVDFGGVLVGWRYQEGVDVGGKRKGTLPFLSFMLKRRLIFARRPWPSVMVEVLMVE